MSTDSLNDEDHDARAIQDAATMQDAVRTFQPTPFKPYLSSNPHFQTIVPAFWPKPRKPPYHRVTLRADDGEAKFHVDLANADSLAPSEHAPHTPVALIIPGLEGDSASPAALRLANALMRTGFKVAVLVHRGCGGADDPPTTPRLTHSGFVDDAETALRAIRDAAHQCGISPPRVVLCGYSLGANIALNVLGRRGRDAGRLLHVAAAAVACVPFDPGACQRELDAGWKGRVYSARLARGMRAKLAMAQAHGADVSAVDVTRARAARRVGHIDDSIIAPAFGFRDRNDYHRAVDARPLLKTISVPTLVINARDDPFFPHGRGVGLPVAQDVGDAPVLVHMVEHGGHCGFLDRGGKLDPDTGFFQLEFARWFHHVGIRVSPAPSDDTP